MSQAKFRADLLKTVAVHKEQRIDTDRVGYIRWRKTIEVAFSPQLFTARNGCRRLLRAVDGV